MPPPPQHVGSRTGRVSFAKTDVEEMEAELQEAPSDLARAVLEQSKAFTFLVNRLATNSSDPMSDLGSAFPTLSSKGAAGRAKFAGGAGCSSWVLLPERLAVNGTTHAASPEPRGGVPGAEGSGRDFDPIFGAFWGLWPHQGHRLHQLASGPLPQSHAGGELPCGEGCAGTALRLPGADGHGQWKDGGGLVAGISGGSAASIVQRPIPGPCCQPSPVRTDSESGMSS